MGEYSCPHCGNPIYDEEVLSCHFCGKLLQRSSKGMLGRMRYGTSSLIWGAVVVVVLLSFIALFIR